MTHTDQVAGTAGGLAVTPAERDLLQLLDALTEPLPAAALAPMVNRPQDGADRTLRAMAGRGLVTSTRNRPPRWTVTSRGSAVLAAQPPLHRRTLQEWRRATGPVTAGEVTDVMLRPVQETATRTRLPQTAWPSRWFGPEHFYGPQHLLAIAASHHGDPPSDAHPGAGPILTVLPRDWWAGR